MIAGSLMVPSRQRLVMRLFDLSSGRCVRASSCAVPAEDQEVIGWLAGVGGWVGGWVG